MTHATLWNKSYNKIWRFFNTHYSFLIRVWRAVSSLKLCRQKLHLLSHHVSLLVSYLPRLVFLPLFWAWLEPFSVLPHGFRTLAFSHSVSCASLIPCIGPMGRPSVIGCRRCCWWWWQRCWLLQWRRCHQRWHRRQIRPSIQANVVVMMLATAKSQPRWKKIIRFVTWAKA